MAYITNSGTEANELALMMARLYTGNFEIISLRSEHMIMYIKYTCMYSIVDVKIFFLVSGSSTKVLFAKSTHV